MVPVEGGAQRALALGQVERAVAEHVERVREAAEQRGRRQQPGARGGELEAERHAVEPAADLRSRLAVVVAAACGAGWPRRRARGRARAPALAAGSVEPGSGVGSGGSGYSCSPRTRSTLRLVTKKCTPGALASRSSTSGAAAVTFSKLSSRISACMLARYDFRLATGSAPAASRMPSACATVGATRAGSRTPERSTNHAPSRKAVSHRAATSIASRLLPMPPGPVSVSRRAGPETSPHTSSASSSRPTSRCHGAGMRERGPGRGAGGAAVGVPEGAAPVKASMSTIETSSVTSCASSSGPETRR